MFTVPGTGLLVSPAMGIWDLVWQAPEAGIALVAVLFTLAMAGLALVLHGVRRRRAVEAVALVVEAPRRPRRARRRRAA